MKREIKFIFSLVVIFFIAYPNFQKFFDLTKKLDSKNQELSTLNIYYSQIRKSIEELKREKSFERMERILPSDPREAEVLNTILNLANEERVLVENFSVSKSKEIFQTTSPATKGEGEGLPYQKISFSLQLACDYSSLKYFLLKLQLLERIPIFESFSVFKEEKKEGKKGEQEETLKMNITFSIFSF